MKKQKANTPTFLPKIIETSKGYKWQVDEMTAKDLASGLVWKLKDEGSKYTYDAAIEKFGGNMPHIAEWEIAERHECIEILKLKVSWYWSASVYANDRTFAWVFSGGEVGYVINSTRSINYSVRCVVR